MTVAPVRPARALLAPLMLLALALAPSAVAHDATFPIEAKKISIDTSKGKSKRKFSFKATGESVIRVANHDPATDGAAIVVKALGKKESTSGLLRLPAENWSTIRDDEGALLGYVYTDKKGKVGGITKVLLRDSKLQVKAKGKKWVLTPRGKHDLVWMLFYFEDEQYCAAFTGEDGAAKVSKNKKGIYKASGAVRPGACPDQLCGNGVVELGEACDDGNLSETDGCNNDCTVGICEGETYDTTYEAIQNVIFDSPVYNCTNGICHDSDGPAGDLDLTAGSSYDNLVDVQAKATDMLRVKPVEPDLSFLYEKLAAKVDGRPTTNSPMPINAPKLSDGHLRGLRSWIRGGAPRDKVVEGTQSDFGTCLPEPDPLKIPEVPPPAVGTGVQLRQPPRPLPANSESEICMSVYYDFSNLIPEEAKVECPERYKREKVCSNSLLGDKVPCETDADCSGGTDTCVQRGILNEGDECFAIKRLELLQDPQSHHSLQFVYAGIYDLEDPGWGTWEYHFDDEDENPLDGQPCDPMAIDPALGINPGCVTRQQSAVACIDYGPPDLSNFLAVVGEDGGAINFNIAQEPIKDVTFPDGVYEVLPVKTALTWNSHAFNLSNKDATLAQYLNLYFADESQQQYPLENIFDAGSIFIQGVPPFETRQYCRTWTAPKGSELFRLSSHTHRFGTLFRVWGPPNTPCVPECGETASAFCDLFGGIPDGMEVCGSEKEEAPIYYSTTYSDPVQLYFDPPVVHDEENVEDRTYYYCADYDNGSTLTSPPIKRASTSPRPPRILGGGVRLGGPCKSPFFDERRCVAGPNRGERCGQSVNGGIPEEVFCETEVGAADGDCDACTVQGGVTTEDEMFILFGDYYCKSEGGCQ